MTDEIDVLREIYIKQHIRDEGVPEFDFFDRLQLVDKLEKENYLNISKFYKFPNLLIFARNLVCPLEKRFSILELVVKIVYVVRVVERLGFLLSTYLFCLHIVKRRGRFYTE